MSYAFPPGPPAVGEPGVSKPPARRVHEPPDPVLAGWRVNVGEPVAVDAAPRLGCMPAEVVVVSWNVAIGLGRLDSLLLRLRQGEARRGSGPRPLVLLIQEAYRADATVPVRPVGRWRARTPARTRRQEIVEIARRHGLSLRYAPSMRNGSEASDRGNAILSTVALGPGAALTLPFARQRRVAVTATIAGLPGLVFTSAHLDTPGLRDAGWLGGEPGGRVRQAEALAAWLDGEASVVLGGDLNTLLGRFDPAVAAFERRGFRAAPVAGRWTATYASHLPLHLDHVLYRSRRRQVTGVEATRIGRDPGGRGRRVLGSDHYPLHARVRLAASA